jgi:hypothetical protein
LRHANTAAIITAQTEESENGHSHQRLGADAAAAEGVVHRRGLAGPDHRGAGAGAPARRAGPIREIRAGDTVWIPPNEKHWHGAGPNTRMVHIAMQEALDGKHVEWMEYVTDEEYSQPVGG